MDDFLAEAYTLECGLILTWVGQEEDRMPDRDVMLPVWASKKIAEILRKDFARKNAPPDDCDEHRLFAQGLWCQIYTPSDYVALDVAYNVQHLVASLVANRSQGSIYGGLTQSIKSADEGGAKQGAGPSGLSSAVRIVPVGLLGTAKELVKVQQGKSPTLVFSAIGAILRRALKVPDGVSFMCLPRFFFGEELVKTALLLEDLFNSDDDELLIEESLNEEASRMESKDPVLV